MPSLGAAVRAELAPRRYSRRWHGVLGADGDPIVANPGGIDDDGDGWDAINVGAQASLTKSATGAVDGTRSIRFASTATSGGNACSVEWSYLSLPNMPVPFVLRFWPYFTALPAQEHRIIRMGADAANTARGLLTVDTACKLGVGGNGLSVAAAGRMATAIALNTVGVRLEVRITPTAAATGIAVLRLYNDPANPNTITEEKTVGSLTFGAAAINRFAWGNTVAALPNMRAFYLSGIAIDYPDWLGVAP